LRLRLSFSIDYRGAQTGFTSIEDMPRLELPGVTRE
jgi:hypothetical protein